MPKKFGDSFKYESSSALNTSLLTQPTICFQLSTAHLRAACATSGRCWQTTLTGSAQTSPLPLRALDQTGTTLPAPVGWFIMILLYHAKRHMRYGVLNVDTTTLAAIFGSDHVVVCYIPQSAIYVKSYLRLVSFSSSMCQLFISLSCVVCCYSVALSSSKLFSCCISIMAHLSCLKKAASHFNYNLQSHS